MTIFNFNVKEFHHEKILVDLFLSLPLVQHFVFYGDGDASGVSDDSTVGASGVTGRVGVGVGVGVPVVVAVGVGVMVGVAVPVGVAVGVVVGVVVGVGVGCRKLNTVRPSFSTGSKSGVNGLSGPKTMTRIVIGPL